MKRIHCFTESQAGGGAERQMNILVGLLAEKGYDVTLVTYANVPDHYVVLQNIKRINLSCGHNPLLTFFKIFWFFLWVKTDCIISYREACNARVLVPMLFRPWTKVIVGERNLTAGSPTWYGKIVCDVLYYRAYAIIPNSFSQEQYLESLNKSWQNRVKTIINYTEVDKYDTSNLPAENKMLKFGVFARFSKQKNPIGLLNAIKVLKDRYGKSFEMHWYGAQSGNINGYNPDFLRVKTAIQENHLEDVFILHPATKDVPSEMAKYHAICLPSFFEGFSNSISEGISCGKPMLVSNVSDNPLMVHDGENGFLFDPNDTGSIVLAFEKFLQLDIAMKVKMGKKSREIAEQLFDKEKFIDSYINLIES